jgi:hypothetical protein
MATPKLVNLAQMTTATKGIGTITLGAATTGYRSFTAAGVVSGDTVRYSISDSLQHEYGTGVVTVAGPIVTMSRVLGGSTTGALLNLSGAAVVTLTPTAEDFTDPTLTAATWNVVVAAAAVNPAIPKTLYEVTGAPASFTISLPTNAVTNDAIAVYIKGYSSSVIVTVDAGVGGTIADFGQTHRVGVQHSFFVYRCTGPQTWIVEWDQCTKELRYRASNATVGVLHGNSLLYMDSTAAARTITIPSDATDPLPVGFQTEIMRFGANSVTLVADVGVTIDSRSPLAIPKIYQRGVLTKVNPNEWAWNQYGGSTDFTFDDWGAVGDGVTDDTAAIQRCLNEVAANGGGNVAPGPKRYLIDSANLLIPAGVNIVGPWLNVGEQAGINYLTLKFALIVNPLYTIMLNGRGSGIKGCVIQRKGLTTPTSLRTGLDIVNAFSGTAITFNNVTNNAASDSYIGYCFIIGFNKAIYCFNNERPHIEFITGDCTNGIDMNFVTDMQHLSFNHFWPFVTAHQGWGFTTYTVTNAINNGVGLIRLTLLTTHTLVTGDIVVVGSVGGVPNATGRWTVTVIDASTLDLQASTFAGLYTTGGVVQVNANRRSGVAYTLQNVDDWGQIFESFCYGWDTGYDVNGSDHVLISNCGCDNWGTQLDPARIGVNVRGTSKSTLIMGHRFASQGNAVVVNTTGTTIANLYSTRIVNCNFWASNTNDINLTQGRAIITGNQFSSNNTGVVGIRAAATFGIVNINGNEFDGTPTPFNLASQVLAVSSIHGNTLNSCVDLVVGNRKVYNNTQPIDATDTFVSDTRGTRFQWRKGRGSPVTPTTVLNADNAFTIEGYGHSGTAFQQCGTIALRFGTGAGQAGGTISNTSMPGSFVVQLTPNASVTPADVMTLDSSALTAPAFIPTTATMPVNGLYLAAANNPAVSAASLLVAKFAANASSVNSLLFRASQTLVNPVIFSQGEANVGLTIATQGTGNINFSSNNGVGGQVIIVGGATAAVNHLNLYGAATTVAPIVEAGGADVNIDLVLRTKGTGQLQVGLAGQMAANGTVATALTAVGPTGANVTVQEWLQIKNSAGVIRYIPCF